MQDNNKEEFEVPKSHRNSVASSKRPLPSLNEDRRTSTHDQNALPSPSADCLQQQQEIVGLRKSLNVVIGTIKRLEQRFNDQQQSHDEHVKNLEAHIQQQEQERGQLKDRVDEMGDTIKRLEQRFHDQQQSHDEHVKNLGARIQQQELERGQLKDRVDEMADTIKRLEQRFNDQQQSHDEHVKNLGAHIEQQELERGQLKDRVDEMADTMKRLEQRFNDQQQSHDEHVKNLGAHIQQQELERGQLKDRVDEHDKHVNNLEVHHQRQEKETAILRVWVETYLETLTIRVNHQEHYLSNGCYIWKIENYEQRRQDAINGVKTDEFSPSIYTSRYGYELRLRICLNGVDSGVGRNIALFVQMVKGDYDDFLQWPFTGKITLSILDQSEGLAFRQHISKTLIAKPNLLAFQQPIAWRNSVCEGHGAMAPIEHIRDPQYIKNNTMLVCIHIEP